MESSIIKSRKNLLEIGDSVKTVYDKSGDLKSALIAIKAYGEATKTAIAQIRYKQLTGNPDKIKFLEE